MDFDRELVGGRNTYNKKVGLWWRQRTSDAAHAYAYRNIADRVFSLAKGKSSVIVDYACGFGDLLVRLHSRLPHSELYGIDGSSFMLGMAKERLKRVSLKSMERVKMIQAELPDFSLPRQKADIAVFTFPHIVTPPEVFRTYRRRYKEDAKMTRFLSTAIERTPQDKALVDDDSLYEAMMIDRVISRNLRSLLKKGGICVRVDYAGTQDDEPSDWATQGSEFEDGTLNQAINGMRESKYSNICSLTGQ